MFGTELRRRRVEAGLSLNELAKRIHYSKSHLSKIETGAKPPSQDLARRCDAALSSDGVLTRLVSRSRESDARPTPAEDDEVWVVSMFPSGFSEFNPVSRRAFLGGFAAAAVSAGIEWPTARSRPAEEIVHAYRQIFDQQRALAQWAPPGALLPATATQTHALRTLAAAMRGPERAAALLLAARFAEHAGWLAQESGDDTSAMWWTDQAVDLATAGGDSTMAAYAHVRRALVAMYRGEAAETIALAEAAEAATTDLRVRGLAAQRAAQGHALAGNYDAAMRALDRAAQRLAGAEPGPDPTIGSTNVVDLVEMARGWCLFDLGRPGPAAAILDAELARMPATALRARARFQARLALAWIASGEPERACEAAAPVIDQYPGLRPATIRGDLRKLSRELNRFGSLSVAVATRLSLGDALYTGSI